MRRSLCLLLLAMLGAASAAEKPDRLAGRSLAVTVSRSGKVVAQDAFAFTDKGLDSAFLRSLGVKGPVAVVRTVTGRDHAYAGEAPISGGTVRLDLHYSIVLNAPDTFSGQIIVQKGTADPQTMVVTATEEAMRLEREIEKAEEGPRPPRKK